MKEIIELKRTEMNNLQTNPLPDRDGVLGFLKNTKPLYYIRTNSLQRLYSELFVNNPSENPQINKLEPVLEEYDAIISYPARDDMNALLIKKQLLIRNSPEYQNRIRLYDQYPYLAFNFRESPFISVKEDTTDELLYLGPLPDRFLLLGTIETFNKITGSPACSGNTFPCILLEEKRCPGYCLNAARYENELKEFVLRYFLKINYGLLNSLHKKAAKLHDNLEFARENTINRDIEILDEYYRYLPFYLTIKNLSGTFEHNGVTYSIKNGLMESATIDNRSDTFSAINNYFTDYEKKELLAVPKENFREMWTLYKYFSFHYPEKIDEISRNSLLSIETFVREL